MKKITVLLADDHVIVREGFRSLLKHERDIEVVGERLRGMMPWIRKNKLVDQTRN